MADCRMQIYNPDGSEAEACGNGIRMFSKYVVEQGVVSAPEDRLVVQTLGAPSAGLSSPVATAASPPSEPSMGPARLRPVPGPRRPF